MSMKMSTVMLGTSSAVEKGTVARRRDAAVKTVGAPNKNDDSPNAARVPLEGEAGATGASVVPSHGTPAVITNPSSVMETSGSISYPLRMMEVPYRDQKLLLHACELESTNEKILPNIKGEITYRSGNGREIVDDRGLKPSDGELGETICHRNDSFRVAQSGHTA